jgi:hypothetical protein
MEKTMGKRDGRDGDAPDRQDAGIASRLRQRAEEYLERVDMQPENSLLERLAEAVLKNMFYISSTASASFESSDFVEKLADADRADIRCRTFYLYYPRSQERQLSYVFRDLDAEVYKQIVKAYERGPSEPPAPRPSWVRSLLARKAWTRWLLGDAPNAPAPPPPPSRVSGLRELINRHLSESEGKANVSQAELNNMWEALPNKRDWLHKNLIGCWLRPHPSDDLTLQVVGHPNLYYPPLLDESQAKKGEPIYLAARLRLAPGGKLKGRLNVHDYNRRSPEYIHIIDTQEQWEFTTGSLEHNNLIIEGQNDLSQSYKITGVEWRDGWQIHTDLPDSGDIELERLGYKCPYLEYVRAVPEIGYVPNLRPRGRVLPRRPAERSRLLQDALLVGALDRHGVTEESVLSAIEVEPGECWLVASRTPGGRGEEAWLCYAPNQGWVCQRLEHRGAVATSGMKSYIWRYNNKSATLPDCYVGELEYVASRPEPIEITATQGQSQAFGRQEPFGDLHDNFLSTSKHLILDSLGRDRRTRALYNIELDREVATPDLFIVHPNNREEPLSLNYAWEGSPPGSVSYDGEAMKDMELDAKNIVQYKEQPLTLCGESILIICGTSTLVLNTSSSIRLGGITEIHPGTTAEPLETGAAPDVDQAPEGPGWASIDNVLVTLRGSPMWADVRRVDRSKGGEQGTYTQGFEFTDQSGSTHFVKCYRSDVSVDEDNRALAEQEVEVYRQCAELPVVPPLEDVLPSEAEPQMLVMPKLQPLEVNGLSLAEILAIGYAMAILLERLEERRLVHYDIRTTKFATDRGRIKLIDYNSVFPVLEEGAPLQPVHRLLVKWGLPEEEFLSPERRMFLGASQSERPRMLCNIGLASSVYALARVLLSIRRGMKVGGLAEQWEEELGSGHGQWVGALLEAMTVDDPAERPTARQVREDMRIVLSELSQNLKGHPDVQRALTLLGPTLDSGEG